MTKKLQVFISSTFRDLRDKRQAAVAAVLMAGHIPAGMELFTAEDRTQLEVIRRWIRESDVYLLIVGARYGAIESESGLSYTELEFNYATSEGKPFFTLVLSDDAIETKRAAGLADERPEAADRLTAFRSRALSTMSGRPTPALVALTSRRAASRAAADEGKLVLPDRAAAVRRPNRLLNNRDSSSGTRHHA